MRWICIICGYVHEGDYPPDICVVCGAAFSAFQREDRTLEEDLIDVEIIEKRSPGTRYVIVGNSAAGRSAAEAIRILDPDGVVEIYSEESVPIYARPLLPDLISGLPHPKFFASGRMFKVKGIDLKLGMTVEAVDTANQRLTVSGETITYDYLLLATGSAPIQIPWPGSDAAGIAYFRTFEDAENIAKEVGPGKHAVAVGGGLLGLEFVRSFKSAGMEVTHLVRESEVGFPCLDEAGGEVMRHALEEMGVTVALEEEVQEFLSTDGHVTGVLTNKGRVIPCDAVGIAVGARPRIELAKESGLHVHRGIVVDRQFKTSAPNVYAAGDVAEAYDRVWHEPRVNTSWKNALEQGRLAGTAMAGGRVYYEGSMASNYQLTAGLPFCSIGISNPSEPSVCQTEKTADPSGKTYRKLVERDGHLIGATLIGDLHDAVEIEDKIMMGD